MRLPGWVSGVAAGVRIMATLLLLVLLPLLYPGGLCQKPSPGKECADSDRTAGKCCIKCPPGNLQRSTCPQDLKKDCKQECTPEHFVDWSGRDPHCEACVTCRQEDDLVEKQRCSSSSERTCECHSGMFCITPIRHTCARCQPHTECPPGFGVQTEGTAQRDTTCGRCPEGTFSSMSSSREACRPHTDCTKTNKIPVGKGSAEQDQACDDPDNLASSQPPAPSHPPNATEFNRPPVPPSSTDPSTLLYIGAGMVSVLGFALSLLLLWTQKSRLACLSAFGPIVADGPWRCSRRRCLQKLAEDHYAPDIIWQGSGCIMSETDSFTGSHEAQSCLELLETDEIQNIGVHEGIVKDGDHEGIGIDAVLQDIENNGAGHEEMRGKDHTNNRIENIYIMKADTVIVGSLSEASRAQDTAACRLISCENFRNPHYPQQESDSSCATSVMLSVEEEGKAPSHTRCKGSMVTKAKN
ncbi:tumor necrosis factor receptor superfamily member 8-like [Ambystoma mexicanum]|uniref:tumor necrosis factor receptor superfamily member 8-like n=1 Tax=Ambystoma mexicanum TaxID=8296 RepID=UPI0037E80FA0